MVVLEKVVIFGTTGSTRAKVVVILQSSYLGKLVEFGKKGYIRAKCLYSGKSDCVRAKLVVFGQRGCIRARVVVFR